MAAAHSVWPDPQPEFEKPEAAHLAFDDLPLPVTIRPARPLTDEELIAFCEKYDSFAIESDADGSIRMMSPAFSQTSWQNQILAGRLLVWAEQSGTGIVFGPDLGVRFADGTMRSPDAAWVSRERWDGLRNAKGKRPAFLPFCPEFVAELRSASDRVSEVEAKMEFWIERGAQLAWLIDPVRKLAVIYRPGQTAQTLVQPEFLEGDGPIEGFRLAMREFWE